MKILVLKEKLKEGISVVERIAQKSLSLPILNNVLIKGEKNLVSLTTTNLEVGIRWWALAKNEKEGEIVVPARLLSGFISFLPDGPLELETEGLFLKIRSGEYKSKIKGFNPDEFPILPQVGREESVGLDGPTFCRALSQVFDIASPSLTRTEISGIFFQFQKGQIKIVATDSFRLGEKKIFFKSSLAKEYSFILPHLTAREIINIFGENKGEVKVYFSPNQALFESMLPEAKRPQVHLISRLVEGDFPDYQTIIPKKFETQAIFPRDEFLNQVKSASLFSGKVNEVRLNISPQTGKAEVSSQNQDFGEYQSFLPGKIKGKGLSASFNHRFLIEGLQKIKTPEVIFELTSGEEPAVLKPVGAEDFLYVVMPIKAS
ncbi:MAG TPA: DNA polymerase III subunit beta [Candidatus Humimicrobiaceae bacterium]|nr:DNA polymerase III subunit beta [Candidatus Humimicrobiaceae bacterium]